MLSLWFLRLLKKTLRNFPRKTFFFKFFVFWDGRWHCSKSIHKWMTRTAYKIGLKIKLKSMQTFLFILYRVFSFIKLPAKQHWFNFLKFWTFLSNFSRHSRNFRVFLFLFLEIVKIVSFRFKNKVSNYLREKIRIESIDWVCCVR